MSNEVAPIVQGDSLRLSVYTIGYESAAECQMVVQELRKQTMRAQIEIIVVAPKRDGFNEALFEGFGASQWLIVPEVRECGTAMAAAVRVAKAPYVTYAEEHSYFREDWAERLVAAHDRGYQAVGFAMENANPTTLTSWAHLYGQFGPVVAPVASQEGNFLAGHHASYQKEMLLGYGPLVAAMMEDEGALFLDLRAKGKKLFIAGDAISRHVNISRLRSYMMMDFVGQRSFASSRTKVGNWPLWRRFVYAAATPLVPLVRARRILYHLKRTGRRGELMPQIAAPIGLALLAGACGEMLGYLFGGGSAAAMKAPVELQRELYVAKKDGWTKPRGLARIPGDSMRQHADDETVICNN